MFKLVRRGRGTRDQVANICWIIEKARKFQKNIYLSFIDYTKAFDSVDHNKLWKTLKEMGIPDHLTCLLRNLYVDQEATIRVRSNFLIASSHCFRKGSELPAAISIQAEPWGCCREGVRSVMFMLELDAVCSPSSPN